MPPSPSALPVSLKSNLHKKGKRFKGWHQRYFEIQGKHLYYYKNHKVSVIVYNALSFVKIAFLYIAVMKILHISWTIMFCL